MDVLTSEQRSRCMSRIRSKNTTPEMIVRRLVASLGYRYRLHRKDLPGKPDLAFISKRKALFVHGCFWHQHDGCNKARMPASNRDYWVPKLEKNIKRDKDSLDKLVSLGWKTLVIWECQTKDPEPLIQILHDFLDN